jgi:hypothetical protein
MAKKKKKKTPEPLEHMVAAIMEDKGVPRDRAYAIATKRLQDIGYMKKGKKELTNEGRKKLSKHYKESKSVRLKKMNKARKHKKKSL